MTTAAAAAAETAAEATVEVVETIVDNSGKILTYVAVVVGGALVVGWLTRRFGEAAMDAAAEMGTLAPPAWALAPTQPAPDDDPDDDDPEPDYPAPEVADGQWAR
jgi:hypothetical protein